MVTEHQRQQQKLGAARWNVARVMVSDDAGARQRRHVIDDADVVNSHITAVALAYC